MGGVCTLIGTSTNIVVADLYENATGKTMNMFSILVPGALCLVVGIMFIVAMRRWLPERKAPEAAFEAAFDYTVELLVPSDNANICKTLGEAGLFHVKGGNLIAIHHFDHDPSFLSEDEFVMGGDRLVYAGQIDEILELKETHDLVVSDHPIRSMNEINKNYELRIAFVNFYSKLIGKTIGGSTLERENNLILVAVARRGKRIEASPREVELQAGDTLLFECPSKTNTYAEHLAPLLQFSDFQEVVKIGPHAIVSSLIMTAMMILTALNVVSLLHGTVLAALAFEEAVINIMSYSHATVIDLQIMNYELQDTNYKLQITLTDDGFPFDPTVRESDTSKAIEERQIGGLGISLMQQIMDELHYQRTDGKNQLIITKNIQL